MTWKAVDGCARSRGSRSSSKAALHFSPGGFRIGSAARHRAQARGGQGEDQADPQQQIGLGFGDRRPSRPANLSAWRRRPRCRPRHRASRKAGGDSHPRRRSRAGQGDFSLLYRLRQPDCRRPSWCRHSGTPSPFVVKLTVTESSACICKKSLTESISDSNLSASAPLRPNAAPAGEMRFGICGGQSPAEKAE